MKQPIRLVPSFVAALFLLIFSCGTREEYNPIGVWEEIGKPENRIILQKKDEAEIASRQKGSFRWYVFKKELPNFYIGDDSNNMEMLSANTMEIFSKKMRQFKKVYRKTDSKIEGFWLLNLLMPRETVEEIVGKPDSISKEHVLEEWFYGERKVIRFGTKGIHSFSENNMLNPDIQSIALGDHYNTVIEKIGKPYQIFDITHPDSTVSIHFNYNGENTEFVLNDSIVSRITLDVPRSRLEWATVAISEILVFQFDTEEIQNEGLVVMEKGKIVDRLSISFEHNDDRGHLRFIGQKYHLIFCLYNDNTFQGVYSRPIKRRRHKEDKFEVKDANYVNFVINTDLLSQNKLGGKISLTIEEPHSKNTVISGSFIIDIPDQTK